MLRLAITWTSLMTITQRYLKRYREWEIEAIVLLRTFELRFSLRLEHRASQLGIQ